MEYKCIINDENILKNVIDIIILSIDTTTLAPDQCIKFVSGKVTYYYDSKEKSFYKKIDKNRKVNTFNHTKKYILEEEKSTIYNSFYTSGIEVKIESKKEEKLLLFGDKKIGTEILFRWLAKLIFLIKSFIRRKFLIFMKCFTKKE